MDDLISRQTAIDFIDAGRLVNSNEPRWSDNEVVAFLKSRPSAERRGRWMDHSDEWDGGYYECSVCGEPWVFIDGTPKDNNANYCPNCGARMEE